MLHGRPHAQMFAQLSPLFLIHKEEELQMQENRAAALRALAVAAFLALAASMASAQDPTPVQEQTDRTNIQTPNPEGAEVGAEERGDINAQKDQGDVEGRVGEPPPAVTGGKKTEGLPGFMPGQDKTRDPQQLQTNLQQKFDRELGKTGDIQAEFKDGKLVLNGTVDSYYQKSRAEQIARGYRGVTDVENNLTVKQGEVNDQQLQQSIQNRLQRHGALRKMNLTADVSGGEVTLKGQVKSEQQKKLAENAIQGVKGVRNINNEIQVTGGGAVQAGDADFARYRGYFTGETKAELTGEQRNQVEEFLQNNFKNDPHLSDADLDVSLGENNAIELTGDVDSYAGKQAAERIVKQLGVQNVQNNIEVHADGGAGAVGTKKEGGTSIDTDERGEETAVMPGQPDKKEGIGPESEDISKQREIEKRAADLEDKQGQQATQGAAMGEQRAEDLTTELKDTIENDAVLSGMDIDVHNADGVITLQGDLNSQYQKEHLMQLVSTTVGVTDVKDNTQIKREDLPKNDEELKKAVESQYFWSAAVDGDKIQVAVQDGTVTLTGSVNDAEQLKAAEMNAYEAGAKQVVNNLTVLTEGGNGGMLDR